MTRHVPLNRAEPGRTGPNRAEPGRTGPAGGSLVLCDEQGCKDRPFFALKSVFLSLIHSKERLFYAIRLIGWRAGGPKPLPIRSPGRPGAEVHLAYGRPPKVDLFRLKISVVIIILLEAATLFRNCGNSIVGWGFRAAPFWI